VFDWARRPDVPLERLRYLCIVSSNLDEFFEVRAAAHITAVTDGDTKGAYTQASFEALMASAQGLARQYQLYNEALAPALAAEGLRIVSHGQRTAEQRRWVQEYFLREVRPLLVPVDWTRPTPSPWWPTSRSTSSCA
jgi:polyphosphate kinase